MTPRRNLLDFPETQIDHTTYMMRFLDTYTLELKDFLEAPSEHYAILSHRWYSLDEEVSYKEYLGKSKKNRFGYKKIMEFCNIAREDGYSLAWIDTCCIDKRSSAELTEAINSMYKWYQNSKRCYVYLYDKTASDWLQSEWWTRGWTLQELVAPDNLVFYDKNWRKIGSKKCEKIVDKIVDATKLPKDLIMTNDLQPYSVGVIMSWASGRTTTRVEDEAYCLLGLFEVSMPMLYGEGRAAFRRLQHIIFDQTGDETIFAFTSNSSTDKSSLGYQSLFATSPKQFRTNATEDGNIGQMRPWRIQPPRFTVWGLEITSDAKWIRIYKANRKKIDYYILRLACGWFNESMDMEEPPLFPSYLALVPYEQRRANVFDCTRVSLPSLHEDPVEQIVAREGRVIKVDRGQVKAATFYIAVY